MLPPHRCISLPERLEQLRGKLLVEADARIAHGERCRLVHATRLHHNLSAPRGELHRVRKQIPRDLLKTFGIGFDHSDGRIDIRRDADTPIRCGRFDGFEARAKFVGERGDEVILQPARALGLVARLPFEAEQPIAFVLGAAPPRIGPFDGACGLPEDRREYDDERDGEERDAETTVEAQCARSSRRERCCPQRACRTRARAMRW